ncbi:MAG: midcut-by-XrtH protein [Chromatiales bacterium]|nr:midcut-by-XrtH protein [Chromatiales bacterium]
MKPIHRIIGTLAGVFTSSSVSAGGAGIIVHEPFARQVPTASGIALVALALLLATLAFRLVRRPSGSGSRFLTLAIAVTAVAAGGSGVKLISDAAAVMPTLNMINATGGEVSVPGVEECFAVANTTVYPQQITEIMSNPPYLLTSCGNGGTVTGAANGGMMANGGTFVGTCTASPGTVLNPGQFCEIYVLDTLAPF